MLRLFQEELSFLKEAAQEYAQHHPKLEVCFGPASHDPDVERLLEGFAFLNSRLRQKIEDRFPEITYDVLDTIWPEFLRPFPSATMLKFSPRERVISERHVVPRGTEMFAEYAPGAPIFFRTTADIDLYPLKLADVGINHTRENSTLLIRFQTMSGFSLSSIGLDRLRLTFCDDRIIAETLYLWSCSRLRQGSLRFDDGGAIPIPSAQIRAGALEPEEALIEEATPAFEGYRLLQEFFLMPEKFTCLDILGLRPLTRSAPQESFTLALEYDGVFPPDLRVSERHIRLYCVPAVNLFRQKAQTIITRGGTLHPLRPHIIPSALQYPPPEIYCVRRVFGYRSEDEIRNDPNVSSTRLYPPYTSMAHRLKAVTDHCDTYYRHIRAFSAVRNRWEHAIAFVDHADRPGKPKDTQINIDLICCNGKAPQDLEVGAIRHGTHRTPPFVTCANITKPSPPVYPPGDDAVLWHVLSNLSPHYFMLRDRNSFALLIAAHNTLATRNRHDEGRHARGIETIETSPVDCLLQGRPVRGIRSVLGLRESRFSSEGEMYLFALVLSRVMAIFASRNSFHKLEVNGIEGGRRYLLPLRPGLQPLI